MSFNLYSVQEDGSKVLLNLYSDLESAQLAMIDNALIYSIEQWDGCFATVLL